MTGRTVLLVDHDQLFAAGLARLLEEDGFDVLPPVATLDAALEALAEEPDLLVVEPAGLDPAGDETATLAALRAGAPAVPLVVMTADPSAACLSASLALGVHGHLPKSASRAVVRNAMSLALLGQRVFPAAALSLATPANLAAIGPNLTGRERDVLSHLVSGLSNKAIARALNVTESTVKMYFKMLARKLRTRNRSQLALWALEHGIRPA